MFSITLFLTSLLLISFTTILPTVSANYTLTRNYSGNDFFNRWSYFGFYDNLTHGDTNYVTRESSTNLAYINSAGNAILKVDNTTNLMNGQKRNSIRITSTDLYDVGSLFVMDAIHVPYGCSVWPAWWSVAQNWPSGGEIDTFEGVNMQTHNGMALHTTSGCTAGGTTTSQSGVQATTNCDASVNGNSGCGVQDSHTNSYGAGFSVSGGGIWATQLAASGISIWFFSRNNIPTDLLTSNTTAVPNPAGWGTPSAYFPSSSCSIPSYFKPQALVLNIALCGDYAGNPGVFASTCSGNCYSDYVLKASSYNTAYFEIPSIRVYFDPTMAIPSKNSAASGISISISTITGTLAFIGAGILLAF